MNSITDVVIMIPSYNPDEKFITFLMDLRNAGYEHIIVIDDGSGKNSSHFFEQAKRDFHCVIVSHSINLGQGRAYKSGFNYYLLQERYTNTIGIVQCDCDGQHKIEDVRRCAELLRENPEKFILGVRNFKLKGIPFRSKIGNLFTSFVFQFFCGLNISDTQTGLKGIPRALIPILLEAPGERFEYASSVLLETQRSGRDILQYPIQTVYLDHNASSHFNPLWDSLRIYTLILKYLASSITSFVLDIGVYSLCIALLLNLTPTCYIILSTYFARIISCSYTFLVNKRFVFVNRSSSPTIPLKFTLIAILQATTSAAITSYLVSWGGTHWNAILSKVVVDTILFFVSFQIQKGWVFKDNVSKN